MAQDCVDVRLNDIGTTFEVTLDDCGTVVPVNGATTQEILFKKPDGTVVTKTSVFTTDGTDGKIEYVTISGDLDQLGLWQLMGHVILPSGDWHSAIGSFQVEDVFV